MKRNRITPEFVEFIPETLSEGVLYISIPYSTATHLCACGCHSVVVTPIHPTEWSLTWDGMEVTLYPSIGNWSLPCTSHYWIRKNQVLWASKMHASLIEAGREEEALQKRRYFDGTNRARRKSLRQRE